MAATHGRLGIVYKWNGTGSNLAAEACTVSGNNAQITDTAKRYLNPNAAVVFTPTNTVNLMFIDYCTGTAHFDAAPGVTTCAGTDAYIATSDLVKTGYLYEWSLSMGLETADITAFQASWKSYIVGMGSATGSAAGYFAGINWFDDLADCADGTNQYFFIELFSYDPDDDRSGDHFDCWVTFTGLEVAASISEVVKETINFTVHGIPVFVANT